MLQGFFKISAQGTQCRAAVQYRCTFKMQIKAPVVKIDGADDADAVIRTEILGVDKAWLILKNTDMLLEQLPVIAPRCAVGVPLPGAARAACPYF